MSNSKISEIIIENGKEKYAQNDTIEINVKFSIDGDVITSYSIHYTKLYEGV